MEFLAQFDSRYLRNHCLTFLIVASPFSEHEPGSVSPVPAALSYSLETGGLWWRHPIGGERVAVSLRDNARLAEAWEPMTEDKLAAAALELGVVGDEGLPYPVVDPEMAALVVSPEGFVARWHDLDNFDVSDIHRLAASGGSLISSADWDRYRLTSTGDAHAQGQRRGAAMVGNGRVPVPDEWKMHVPTLGDCAAMMAAPIEESGNHIQAGFTAEAAQFVQQQFGVNPMSVDWPQARKFRTINRLFSSTAGFDKPAAACAALRLASLSARAQTSTPAPAVGGPLRDQVQRVSPQLPTRPGM